MSFLEDVGGFFFGWLAPEAPEPMPPGTELTSAQTDAHIGVVIGKVHKTTGNIIFKETNDGDSDDIKNDLLHIIVVWAEKVESIDEVYVDDIPVSSDNPAFFHDDGGRVVHMRNFPDGMDNYEDPLLTAAGWRASDKLSGKACSYIRLEYHGGEFAISSEPKITADLTGTTHSNPALATFDYLRDPLIGKGLPDRLINSNSFYKGKDLCQSLVDEIVGQPEQRPLFSCNCKLDTSKDILENVNVLLKPMRGWLPIIDGQLTLVIEQDDDPVDIPILEKDILDLDGVSEGSKNKRYNRVAVTYYEPAADGTAQEAVYPPKGSALEAQLLEEDNGFINEGSVDLVTCNNYYEALEFAKTWLEISREQTKTRIHLPKWALIYDVGDIVPVYESFLGWEGKLFRIEKISSNKKKVILSVREHQPYIYDFYGEGNKPEIPDTSYSLTNPDEPSDLTVEHVYSAFVQVKVSWYSEASRFLYQVLDEQGLLIEADSIGRYHVNLSGYALGNYRFRVMALGGLSARSGWAETPLIMQKPGSPTDIKVIPTATELEVIPYLAGSDSSTAFLYSISHDLDDEEPPLPYRGPAHTYTFPGLAPDRDFKLWVCSSNSLGESAWNFVLAKTKSSSEAIEQIVTPILAPITIDIESLKLSVDDIDNRFVDFEAKTLSIVQQERISTEAAQALLLQSISENAAYQIELARRIEQGEELTNAVVYRDPSNGLIVNRAYNYADDKFTEASLKIDGVSGEVELASKRIENTEDAITSLSSELSLIPGIITAKATAIVSESISALEPAYAFNFFDSAQGWQAVNGTLTAGLNEITVTHGDIENNTLNYLASENKLIRVSLQRLAGSGWDGTVIIERDDNSVETYANYVEEATILLIDFSAMASYTGTVTRVRLVLGASVSDEFKISSISIGKADATTQDLANITSRVNAAELAINANEAEIAQRVSTSYFNEHAITVSNVEQKVNALDTIIALEAKRQELIDNNVIQKAVSAATFLNGQTGTIQDIVQGFEQDIEGVESSISDVQQQVNSLGITEQVAGLASQQIQTYDVQAALLQQAVNDLSAYMQEAETNESVALAVNQLQIDVSPEGALAKDIGELQTVTLSNGNAITATNKRLSQVETDAEGNASAIEQLNLSVSGLSGNLTGALSRIDLVEVKANENAISLSAIEGRATNIEQNVVANFTLAQEAIVSAQNAASNAAQNASSITRIENDVSILNDDLTATNTIAQQAKATAESAEGKATTNTNTIQSISNAVNDSANGLSATNTIAQQAKTTAESAEGKATTNASAITGIKSTAENAESKAQSALTLLAEVNNELDEYRAVAQLAVDANGNAALIQLGATPDISEIIFKAMRVIYQNSNGVPKLFFDTEADDYVFGGTLRSNASENIGANYMELANPDGFGPDGLTYYYGPKFMSGSKPDYTKAKKANATQWRDTAGDSYFGGSLSAGVLSSSTQNPTIALNPTAEIGPLSTNGNSKTIAFSFYWEGDYVSDSACPTSPLTPTATLTLQRSIGGGSWSTLQTRTMSGSVETFPFNNDGEEGCNIVERASAAFTFTDPNSSMGTFSYRVVVSSQQRYLLSQFITRQILSIISTEE